MATEAHGGRIGVDIGGTFTDLVWVDDATGATCVGKLLTTPKEPAQAVEQGTTATRYALRAGATLAGPAIVEERESTLVVGPGGRFEVAASGNIIVTIG